MRSQNEQDEMLSLAHEEDIQAGKKEKGGLWPTAQGDGRKIRI